MGSLLEIKQQVREGSLSGALTAAKAAVRNAPTDASLRSALFALFAANGEWARASDQLETCLRLGGDPAMALYGIVMGAGKERDAVMNGTSDPHFPAGKVPAWAAPWRCALAALDAGDPSLLASEAQARFEVISSITGFNDEYEFEGFRCCDVRTCGVFEGVFNGRYGWLPFEDVLRIAVPERPEFLQDLVWLPVMVHLRAGSPLQGYLYATSPGTSSAAGEAERLARSTAWDERFEELDISYGAQLFALGDEVVPVFSLGKCCFNEVIIEGEAGEPGPPPSPSLNP
jgi:protein involved in temperature-dependent protein secretion